MSFLSMTIITLVILQISVFCTTIFLHRAKTHRGLELHPALGFLMHLHITLFTGIVPRQWVAVHRKHHHFSDEEGDPHSPLRQGLWKVLFGNFFLYKAEAKNSATVAKYTPDWKNDPLDPIPHLNFGVIGGLAIFCAMFGLPWGIAAWGFHVVAYILLNSSINSLGHMIGYRNFQQQATNLRLVALLTAGEGLHNNHHEHPSSARFALRRYEFDPAWPVIVILEKLRLAKINRLAVAKAA